jgi:threonine aldolase
MSYAPAPADHPAPIRVNLFSDTQTRPTAAMKEAMMAAECGDEQLGLDPTVNQLCERVAALLGKEAAVFLPSGTMCNAIGLLVHTRPGDEVLAHGSAHIIAAEGGAAGALAGVQIGCVPGERGQFTAAALRTMLRPATRNSPPQRLVSAEQTANFGGGTVWPQAELDRVATFAHAHGMATHMDGARLLNATVASGVPAARMGEGWDSVWLDFTKGLGAPLGAVLAGSHAFIGDAWRWKQRLGGALRQAGLCAAACLYALDHNVERLADDHANARRLADGLAGVPGLRVPEPETNLVFIETDGTGFTAAELAARLRAEGVLVSAMGEHRLRACTHLDVSEAGVIVAVDAIRSAVAAGPALAAE